MRGLWTIFRREMTSYFSSPIAYIFIIVFLLVTNVLFLFITRFFAFPRAEMIEFFGVMIPVLCVFIPAITMRVWAEDRKENTIEMLMTFPLKPTALVLGKYLAALSFYAVTLACTWVVPFMMAWLGDPDSHVIICGYLGAFLAGALFIALGTFVSSLCKDQVVAFVLSFLCCVVFSLLGWEYFINMLDSTVTNLGTLLNNMFAMTGHFLPFTRGIVDGAHILYFFLWTAMFLFLNGMHIEGRSRPHMTAIFTGAVVICVVIGALAGIFLSDTSGRRLDTRLVRFDLTEDKIYTVTDATNKILRDLDVPVQVTFYISESEKLPPEMKRLERDVADKLREMSVASGRKLQWKTIHLEVRKVLRGPGEMEDDKSKDKERKKSLEERLLDKGVRPFSISVVRGDQQSTQLIYSAIGIAYREKEEEIIPRVMPGNLPELEYRIMNVVKKLSMEKQPVVVLFAPLQEIPPQMMQMYMKMGRGIPQPQDFFDRLQQLLEYEKIDVRRVKLNKHDRMPDEYDALLVVNPRELDDRQKWEINRALVEGKPTLIAVQNYRFEYNVGRGRISLTKHAENPGIDEVLSASGIEVDENILMDESHGTLLARSDNPLANLLGGGGTPVSLPMHVIVKSSSMNQDLPITSRIDMLFCPWASRIKIDEEKVKENKLDVTTIVSTSPKAWTVSTSRELSQEDLKPPADAKQMPLVVYVRGGRFANAYPDMKEPPAWADAPPPRPGMMPPPPEANGPVELHPKEGHLILVGCAEMFIRNMLQGGNMNFLMNCVHTMTIGEDLVRIGSKKPFDRMIDKSGMSRAVWYAMLFGLMNTILVAAGVARAVFVLVRRRRYRAVGVATKQGDDPR